MLEVFRDVLELTIAEALAAGWSGYDGTGVEVWLPAGLAGEAGVQVEVERPPAGAGDRGPDRQ